MGGTGTAEERDKYSEAERLRRNKAQEDADHHAASSSGNLVLNS